jgi:hypothetical protein
MELERNPWGWKVTTVSYIEHEYVRGKESQDFEDALNNHAQFQGQSLEPVWEEPKEQGSS